MNNKIIKVLTVISYLIMVVVNYLAVTLPIAGRSTGEISDSYPNLFAPAGYAFSIWGVIYLLLGIYVVYQFTTNEKVIDKINRIFIINTLLNSAWIFAWHYDIIWLSVIIMIGILITLIKIADILRKRNLPKKNRWIVVWPFAIYFGWITVATIANITTFLVKVGWNGFGLSDTIWMVIVLLVGAVIGILRFFKDKFVPYGLVLLWAYGAILYKHLAANGFGGQYPVIVWTTVVCLIVFLISIITLLTKKSN